MAFGGSFNACLTCNHPRCLHCVQQDIDALRSRDDDDDDDGPAVPPHRFVGNCLFCAERADWMRARVLGLCVGTRISAAVSVLLVPPLPESRIDQKLGQGSARKRSRPSPGAA